MSALGKLAAITLFAVFSLFLRAPPAEPASERHEIAFIESNLADYRTLVAGVKPGTEVHVLDCRKDGLAQMALILAGRRGIAAIHLLSRGAPGKINLGTFTLTNANLKSHAGTLAAIGAALAADGDFLVYGCYVAKGAVGRDLLGKLAQATKAQVAASDNATGSASRGGDWNLEVRVGKVATDAIAVADYGEMLAVAGD